MATFRVSNQSQLDNAVREARGGDTIELAAGTYDDLDLVASRRGFSHLDFGQKVTITSADSSRPAVINELLIRGSSNIELKNLTLDYEPSRSGDVPFMVDNASRITFSNVRFEGEIVRGYGDGIGLRVKNSSNVSVENSEIINFDTGVYYVDVMDGEISSTNFRGMPSNGILLGGITRMNIEGNDFRNMNSNPNDLHKDMIQFSTTIGESPSRDVVIRDNVIYNPEVSHAIFFGNGEARAGDMSVRYQNILIEDNYINSAHLHGITVEHGDDITIRNNRLVHNSELGHDDQRHIPLINVSRQSTDVTINGNTVASVPDEQNNSWSVYGNTLTSGRNLLHWFGNYSAGGSDGGSGGGNQTPDRGPTPIGSGDEQIITSTRESGDDVFRVNGVRVDGRDTLRIKTLDFGDGDRLIFNGFGDGTFRDVDNRNPLQIWDNRSGAMIDSVADFRELVTFSSAVSATTRSANDALVLEIDFHRGVGEIVIDGLGAAYRATDDMF